jgi:crossover junction endodeoxyribonuclease RusA
MKLILPYPDKELMPNRKNGKHWGATSKVKQQAIHDAFYATKEAFKTNALNTNGLIPLAITFVQSDKRHRDLDNLLAASKPAIDGIAKALNVDDSIFEPITIKRGYNTKSFMEVDI